MGTSASASGTGPGKPLVPSWLDDPDTGPLPGGDDESIPGDGVNGDVSQNGQDGGTKPPLPATDEGQRFSSARANFTRFARSGGSDQSALHRAVRDYVHTGIKGSNNAVRRMGSSRAAASRTLGVLRGLQRDGIQETLHRHNLLHLSGRSIQEIFIGLTEIVCQDGGLIDDAIARDAWLETIADLDQFSIDNLDALTDEQVRELFLNFIAHSIEVRIYQEIGVNSFKLSCDLADIESFDEQFRNYIERSVQDSFHGDLSNLSDMSDDDIRNIVDKTYLEAWELLKQIGDQEG